MQIIGTDGHTIDGEEDLITLLDADRPMGPAHRPVVTTNMVMSLDGAYAVQGRSGGLSSEADFALFLAQRSLADVILVGASTVRTERYRRPVVSAPATAVRSRRGQSAEPRVVVVSRSLELSDDLDLLDGAEPRPILAHPRDVDASAAPAGFDRIAAGSGGVDLTELLGILHDDGVRWVVAEGGPGLLGQLAEQDLIDEYLLTLSPRLAGGTKVGLLSGATAPEVGFTLERTLRAEDHLMMSYRRATG